MVVQAMKQETFTDIEYSLRKKKTKREEFLEIMDEIIPWDEWIGVIAPYYPRVYLKTPNAPGQRAFSHCAAAFSLEIRQYSCVKMPCSAQKFLAAGHFASFQIHPRKNIMAITIFAIQ